MEIIINNEKFGEIYTIVFYEWYKYPPITSGSSAYIPNFTSNMVQFRVNKSFVAAADFSEYEFLYKIEKEKFNDDFIINYLSKDTKEVIGKNPTDLSNIEKTLFPTISEENSDLVNEYFGSTLISGQNLFLFDIPKNYWKIELYDSSLISNSNSYSGFVDYDFLNSLGVTDAVMPAISIYLGPTPYYINNSNDMYFSGDPRLNQRTESTTMTEYRELIEEIRMNKVMWTLLSSASNTIDVNLSLKAWENSVNPNRNLNEWAVRNDYMHSTINSVDVIERVNNSLFWNEVLSGNLVGNQELKKENCILFKNKVNRSTENNKYSPFVRYRKGDIVNYGGSEWESLCDNNYNNNPYVSTDWLLKEYVTSLFSKRLSISSFPLSAGYTVPSTNIIIPEDLLPRTFIIHENFGYNINTTDTCSNGKELLPTSDYVLSIRENDIKELTIQNWEKILETNRLVVNYELVYSELEFLAFILDTSQYINYNNWETELNGFKILELKINDIIQPTITSPLFIGPTDIVEISIPSSLEKYNIDSIDLDNTTLDSTEIDGTIHFTITNFSDYDLKCNVNLKIKELNIIVDEFSVVNFEVSNIFTNTLYEKSEVIGFYSKISDASFTEIIIINSDTNDQISIFPDDLNKVIPFKKDNINLQLDSENNIYLLNFNSVTSNYLIKIL